MAAGNTDAHLKNFGLVYADLSDVRLAPMFDRVTAKVYAPCRSAAHRGRAGGCLGRAGRLRARAPRVRCVVRAENEAQPGVSRPGRRPASDPLPFERIHHR